jgi:hypothetical protein
MTELELQAQVADYIRLQYPTVIFHSDYGSGIKLTMGQAIKQKRLNGGRRSWPDMFLAEPKGKYSGLFIELKKEGVRIYKKDGTLVSDEHIREQYDMLEQLRRRGYAANFSCGFDEAKALIDRYMRCAD